MENVSQMSLLEIAIQLMEQKTGPQNILALIKEALALKGVEDTDGTISTELYIDITTSSKFVYMGNEEWDLKSRQSLDEFDKDGSAFNVKTEDDEEEDEFDDLDENDLDDEDEDDEDRDEDDEEEDSKDFDYDDEEEDDEDESDEESDDEDELDDGEDLERYTEEGFNEDKYNDYMDDYEDMYDEN